MVDLFHTYQGPLVASVPDGTRSIYDLLTFEMGRCLPLPLLIREVAMGFLIFICPRSHRLLDSGIALDAAAFRQTRKMKLTLCCPHCVVPHEVSIGEGLVSDDPPSIYQAAA
jgi:hypothetical protein